MKFLCTKHNTKWDVELVGNKYHAECPGCMQDTISELQLRNRELREHRDLMISAIDLARTIQIQQETN